MCCYMTNSLTAGVTPQDPDPNTNLKTNPTLTLTLTQVGEGEYVLLYDRLANGWSAPPGPYGDKDSAFAMRLSWTGPR